MLCTNCKVKKKKQSRNERKFNPFPAAYGKVSRPAAHVLQSLLFQQSTFWGAHSVLNNPLSERNIDTHPCCPSHRIVGVLQNRKRYAKFFSSIFDHQGRNILYTNIPLGNNDQRASQWCITLGCRKKFKNRPLPHCDFLAPGIHPVDHARPFKFYISEIIYIY